MLFVKWGGGLNCRMAYLVVRLERGLFLGKTSSFEKKLAQHFLLDSPWRRLESRSVLQSQSNIQIKRFFFCYLLLQMRRPTVQWCVWVWACAPLFASEKVLLSSNSQSSWPPPPKGKDFRCIPLPLLMQPRPGPALYRQGSRSTPGSTDSK